MPLSGPNQQLISSASGGDLAGVREALELGADINCQDEAGFTALHRAAQSGCGFHHGDAPSNYFDVASLLITRGANIETKAQHGHTALHVAGTHNFKIGQLLIEQGANMGARVEDPGYYSFGYTPLHYAAAHGNTGLIGFLFAKGANFDAVDGNNKTPFEIAIDSNQPSTTMLIASLNLKLKAFDKEFNRYKQGLPKNVNPPLLQLRNSDQDNHHTHLQHIHRRWLQPQQNTSAKQLVKTALKESLGGLNPQPVTAIQFDIAVIKRVAASLNKQPIEQQSNLMQHIQHIVGYHREHMESLSCRLGNEIPFNTVNDLIEPLAEFEQTLIQQCLAPVRQNQNLPALQVPELLETKMQELGSLFQQGDTIVQATTRLFGNVDDLVTQVDTGLANVKQLENHLATLVNNPLQAVQGIIDAKLNLKKAHVNYQQQATALNTALHDIGHGIQVVGQLAGLINAPQEVQHIIAIATAGVDIINTVASFGAMVAMSGPAAPVVAIAGALGSILGALGLFGNNQNNERLEQISQQITQLAQHMDNRFDRVENMLGVLHEQMHARFDRLETMLTVMNTQIHGRFDHLEDMLTELHTDIKKDLNEIQRTTKEVQAQVHGGFKAIAEEDYVNLVNRVDGLVNQTGDTRISRAIDCASELTLWVKTSNIGIAQVGTHGNKPALTGSNYQNNTQLYEHINRETISYSINLIASYLRSLGIKTSQDRLVNPIFWADAVENYFKVHRTVPTLEKPISAKQIKVFLEEGKKLNQFIKTIQTSDKLFDTLCSQYQTAVVRVLNQFNQNEALKGALKELNTAYQLLAIFTRLAFEHTVIADDALNDYLDTQLWTRADVERYLTPVIPESNKSFLLSAIEQNTSKVIKGFREFLLTQVIEASYATRQGLNKGHPSICAVIEELELTGVLYADIVPQPQEALLPLQNVHNNHHMLLLLGGTGNQEFIPRAVHRTVPNPGIGALGLSFIPIPKDGHCLYRSAGLYMGEEPKFLRRIVAAHLQHNSQEFASFITLAKGQRLEDYLNAVRDGNEWATHTEIEILMRVLNRPILVIGPDNRLVNPQDKQRFTGEPIFVYYNGHNHYDGLVLQEGRDAQFVLDQLKQAVNEVVVQQPVNREPVRGNQRLFQSPQVQQPVVGRGRGLVHERRQNFNHPDDQQRPNSR